jgi:uncharacterized protein
MDALVAKIVDAISREIQPTRIILFGSRATGRARPDSDVDLLIIYDGPLSKRELKLRVRHLFLAPDFSMDLFVLSADEFQRQQNVVSTLGRVAAREGLVCYG